MRTDHPHGRAEVSDTVQVGLDVTMRRRRHGQTAGAARLLLKMFSLDVRSVERRERRQLYDT
jgi:hypothetical protein